jgi:hypothetical protein
LATFSAPGLAALDPAETAIFTLLEAQFQGIADKLGAIPVSGPPLLGEQDLVKLDFFRNFPHLALTAARFSEQDVRDLANGAPADSGSQRALQPTGIFLPTATCYGLLLALQGRRLAEVQRLTAVGLCLRNEQEYVGLRRLRGFHMREVLYVGSSDGALAHLEAAADLAGNLARAIGLRVGFEPACDPFYLGDGPRSLLTRLDPVKHEFVVPDGTAIGSVNRHRNFFGDRLDIWFGGAAAYSACLAFGVERWVHALVTEHGTAERALAALRAECE